MTEMVHQAIKWMRSVKSLTAEKLFFIYFAPGATQRRTIRGRWWNLRKNP